MSDKDNRRRELVEATARAMRVLKPGDRIRVTKCPGTKRTITFDHFNGWEIISKSGRGEYSARSIDRLNGAPVNFKVGAEL
jgi:hypothetical protein